jgi:hypothetical protein
MPDSHGIVRSRFFSVSERTLAWELQIKQPANQIEYDKYWMERQVLHTTCMKMAEMVMDEIAVKSRWVHGTRIFVPLGGLHAMPFQDTYCFIFMLRTHAASVVLRATDAKGIVSMQVDLYPYTETVCDELARTVGEDEIIQFSELDLDKKMEKKIMFDLGSKRLNLPVSGMDKDVIQKIFNRTYVLRDIPNGFRIKGFTVFTFHDVMHELRHAERRDKGASKHMENVITETCISGCTSCLVCGMVIWPGCVF